MGQKKSRNHNHPPKGAVILSMQSPKSKFIHQWLPPRDSAAYFMMDSDDDFKARHPVGYGLLVTLAIVALVLPIALYMLYAFSIDPEGNGWMVLGWIGAFIIGIGLFNFVAIFVKQYMGHLLSILCFLIGGIMIAVSLQHF